MPYLKETLDAAFKEWISSLNGETEYDQPQSFAFEAGYKRGFKDSLKPKPIYNFSCNCSWRHKDVYPGFKCHNCGRIFEP